MNKNKRLEGIQILRAIAFLEIFLGHCGIDFFAASFGVAIFTILSGFCMAINYLPKADTLSLSPVANVKFGISKVKKLYILHLIMLAIIYVIVGMPTSGSAMERMAADILLLKCWRPHSEDYYSYNGVAWYLSMYMFVCMLAPYVLRLVAKMKQKRQIFGWAALTYALMLGVGYYVSAVSIPIGDSFAKWLTYICPLYRVLDFSLGVMLGWLFLHRDTKKEKENIKSFLLEILAAAAFIFMEWAYLPVKENYTGIGYTAYFTVTALLLIWVFAVEGSVITKTLNNKVLLWIGNISSVTFLIHQVVIRWVKMNLDKAAMGFWYLPFVIISCFVITIAGTYLYFCLQKLFQKKKYT